ncbi:MAG: hypothetical protein ACXAD7_28995, partial [Candidatus Kariarchaeaceae archaeon]
IETVIIENVTYQNVTYDDVNYDGVTLENAPRTLFLGSYTSNLTTGVIEVPFNFAHVLPPGNYSIKVIFEDDEDFDDYEQKFYVGVKKALPSIYSIPAETYWSHSTQLKVYLNHSATPLHDATIFYYLRTPESDWVEIGSSITNIDGLATCDYSTMFQGETLRAGDYEWKANFTGSDLYTSKEIVNTLQIHTIPVKLSLEYGFIRYNDPMIIQ